MPKKIGSNGNRRPIRYENWNGAIVIRYDGKLVLLSYRITPNGNRKRVGSIQQHFCFHWTAKCDGSLRNRPKSDPIRLSLFVNIRKSVHNFMNIISHIKADTFACQFNIKTTFIFEHKGFFSCSLIQ